MENSSFLIIQKPISLRQALRWLEKSWHVFAFLILFGTLLPLWRNIEHGITDQSEGDIFLRNLQILVYCVSLFILLFYIPKIFQIMVTSPWIWLISLWAVISFLWSDYPNLAFRRAVAVLLGSLYGLVLYFRFNFKEIIKILFYVFVIIIILSFFFILFKPEWGVMGPPHAGAWRGVFTHKNGFARILLFALMVFLYEWNGAKGLSRLLIALLMGLTIFMIIKATSMTVFLVIMILVVSSLVIKLARHLQHDWPILLIFITGAIIFSLFFLYLESDFLLMLIGKDTTLTGRIPMWGLIIEIGLQRPILGFGYRTFWLGFNGPSAPVWKAFSWHPQHAHNGYIDIFVQLGLVGLILKILLISLMVRIAFLNTWLNKNKNIQRISFFIFCFLIFTIFSNLTTTILVQSGIADALFWILFSYFYIYMTNDKGFRLNEYTVENSSL